MTVKRNWLLQKVIRCDVKSCGATAPLWKAVLPGSGWKVSPNMSGPGQHSCPKPTCTQGSYYHLGGH